MLLVGLLMFSTGSSTFRSNLVLFRVGGCVKRAADVRISGAPAVIAVGWSVNLSKLYGSLQWLVFYFLSYMR